MMIDFHSYRSVGYDNQMVDYGAGQAVMFEPLEPRLLLSASEGDFNDDGEANLLDLDIMVQHWGYPGSPSEGDANADGYISLADLFVLKDNFTQPASQTPPLGVSLTAYSIPSTGLSGYRTHTITLSALAGQITSIGLVFSSSDINQVNPYGLETAWADNNDWITAAGIAIDNDSQFLFNQAGGIVSLSEDPGGIYESTTTLQAHFSGFTPFSSMNIAQIVLPDGAIADYGLTVVLDHTTLVHLHGEVGVDTGDIQGTKWHDANGDGFRDAGEQGLAGWTIFLDDNGDNMLDPDESRAVTDANGDYQFTNLVPGPYTVAEVLTPGWSQSYPGDPSLVHNLVVVAGAVQTGIDFGNIAPPGQITGEVEWYCDCGCEQGGYSEACMSFLFDPEGDDEGRYTCVYLDLNDNGQYDLNEPKEEPAEPQPKPQGGWRWYYAFDDVEPGTYKVAQVRPANSVQHFPSITDTHTVTVSIGETVSGINFSNEYICPVQDPAVDFNDDCFVGLMDLDILGNHWGLPATPQQGDANDDGYAGLEDLVLFSDHPYHIRSSEIAVDDIWLMDSAAASTNLPGYDTHTISLEAGTGHQITSIGLNFTASVINQVNPMDMETIFMDNNIWFSITGNEVDNDSQFLFNQASLICARNDEPGGIFESATTLRGHFTGLTPFTSGQVAQIVVPAGVDVNYDLSVILDHTMEVHQAGVLPAMSVPVPAGDNQAVSTGGGASVPGGVEAVFDHHNGGYFASYLNVIPLDELTPGQLASYTFQLPTDPLVSWDLNAPGGFTGQATLTFCYLSEGDPSGNYPFQDIWPHVTDLNGDSVVDDADEMLLAIYHYDGGAWVELPGVVDPVNHTITVTVDHLSPFALGNQSQTPPPVGSFHGQVWLDADGNGNQNGGETDLDGWTIFLDENVNGLLDPAETFTTTDTHGTYHFVDMPVGDYNIRQLIQVGWEETYPGSVTGPDGYWLTLENGDDLWGYDFGNRPVSGLPEPNGDFNGDGAVGLLDLDILGQNWGTAPGATKLIGDANGDGMVGLLDLDILGQTWGMSAMRVMTLTVDPNAPQIHWRQLELDDDEPEVVRLF